MRPQRRPPCTPRQRRPLSWCRRPPIMRFRRCTIRRRPLWRMCPLTVWARITCSKRGGEDAQSARESERARRGLGAYGASKRNRFVCAAHIFKIQSCVLLSFFTLSLTLSLSLYQYINFHRQPATSTNCHTPLVTILLTRWIETTHKDTHKDTKKHTHDHTSLSHQPPTTQHTPPPTRFA